MTAHRPGDGVVREVELLEGEAGVVALARQQVAAGDLALLLLAVAREFQHFHTIQQGRGDAVQVVGGSDEEHLGKIEGQIQVVVAELLVLRRIEDFHQRRGRVAAKVAAELVYFVQHQHGVAHAGASHGLQNAARHGADVGAAMAAQFGFVVQAAQAHALELAPHGAGDGLAERRLADARRADEAEDVGLGLGIELQHG